MLYPELMTPSEVAKHIAKCAKEKRLSLNMSQQSLAQRSGVSLGSLKKFEQTGQISLASLLRLALVLGSLADFVKVFAPKPPESFPTLNALMKQKTRKRGRK